MCARREVHTLAIADVSVTLSVRVLDLENAASGRATVVGVRGHGVGIAGSALLKRVADKNALSEVVLQENTVARLEGTVGSVGKRDLYSNQLIKWHFLPSGFLEPRCCPHFQSSDCQFVSP